MEEDKIYYILLNNAQVTPVKVIRKAGNLYTVKFLNKEINSNIKYHKPNLH